MQIDSDNFDFNLNELEESVSTNNFKVGTYLFRVLVFVFHNTPPKEDFTFNFKMSFKDDKILSDAELDSLILGEINKLNIFNMNNLKIFSCSYRPAMEDVRILN